MEDIIHKKEHSDSEEKANNETMETSLDETNFSKHDAPTPSVDNVLSENRVEEEEEKKDNKIVTKLTKKCAIVNIQPVESLTESNKTPELTDHEVRRSNTKDQSNGRKGSRSESDSDDDSSKRQKLNECQPNTSSAEGSSQKDSQNSSNFKKLEPKVRKRSYRSQSNSNEVPDSASDNASSRDSNPIEEDVQSSSSESIEFQRSARIDLDDSSDEASEGLEDNGDSIEWTTASDDDTDEMPAVLQKEPSKSDWSLVKDVINRQIGCNNFLPRRFYGSLHAVQRLELMYKLDEHLGCVNAIGFNQKGNLLASASDDLTVTIWNWAIGKTIKTIQTGHRSNVFQSKFLPLDPENLVISCARDGQVRLMDIETNVIRKLASHRAPCHKITTHLDLPHIILSAGEDSKVFMIDVRESKPSRLLSVRENDQDVELYSIQFHPLNNHEFCISGRTRTVKIYDRRKPTEVLKEICPKHLLSDYCVHVPCAVYNHDGTEIIASYNNEDIYLFDIATKNEMGDFAHKYQGHRNSATVKGVNFFGPNSEFILSGSDCGNIFIWDKKTEAVVQWMPGDEQGIVNALEPHPHIPILATSGLDYDVKIWVPSKEENPNIKKQLQSCIKKNLAARSKHAEEAGSAFDGHVLWIMLRHLRQAGRRRIFTRLAHRDSNNIDESDINIDDDDDDDEDDDDNDNDSDDDDDDDDDGDLDLNGRGVSSSSNSDSNDSDD